VKIGWKQLEEMDESGWMKKDEKNRWEKWMTQVEGKNGWNHWIENWMEKLDETRLQRLTKIYEKGWGKWMKAYGLW